MSRSDLRRPTPARWQRAGIQRIALVALAVGAVAGGCLTPSDPRQDDSSRIDPAAGKAALAHPMHGRY